MILFDLSIESFWGVPKQIVTKTAHSMTVSDIKLSSERYNKKCEHIETNKTTPNNRDIFGKSRKVKELDIGVLHEKKTVVVLTYSINAMLQIITAPSVCQQWRKFQEGSLLLEINDTQKNIIAEEELGLRQRHISTSWIYHIRTKQEHT